MPKTLLWKKSLTLVVGSPLAFLVIAPSDYKANLKSSEKMSITYDDILADQETISRITKESARGNSFKDFQEGKLSEKEIPRGEFKSYNTLSGAKTGNPLPLWDNPIDRSGIRVGGGLIFDLPYDEIQSNEIKEQMDDQKVFATHGFISSNTPEIIRPGDLVAKETVRAGEGLEAGNHKYGYLDFSKDPLSITPNNTPTTEKSAFLKLFNLELFVWYWNTWNKQLYVDNPTTTNDNLAAAKAIEAEFFDKSSLVDRPEINLSVAWNKNVEEEVNISAGEKFVGSVQNATVGALVGMAFTNPIAAALAGGLSSIALDFMTGKTESQSENTENIGDYYSQYLDRNFWKAYFDKYLGTPDQSTNKIYKFYEDYNYFPSQLEMNDFDIELSNIKIDSNYRIMNDVAILASAATYDSWSTIDLSNLEIGLNTDITLQRESPDVHKMLEKLDGYTIWIYTSDIGSMDSADEQTTTAIRKAISMSVPELGNFRNGLTFTNQLIANESVSINVFYDGILQNIDFKIHLNVDTM